MSGASTPTRRSARQREEGSLTVSDKASVAATITFEEALDPDGVVIGRNTVQTMIFKNLSDELTKFVVQAGEREALDSAGQPLNGPDGEAITEPVEFCTDLVRPDTQQAADRQLPRAGLVPDGGAGRGGDRPRGGHGGGAVSDHD